MSWNIRGVVALEKFTCFVTYSLGNLAVYIRMVEVLAVPGWPIRRIDFLY